MSLFRHFSITGKFITLALLVSATAWGVLDCFQSRIIEEVFKRHIDSDLKISARDDRELFDTYLASFRHSARLLTANQKLTRHFLSSEWNNRGENAVIHRSMPKWLPGRTVLRAMPLVHYFLLLDQDGRVGEIFSGDTETVPHELRNPRPLFHRLSHNQSLLTRLGNEAFVVTSSIIFDENNSVLGNLLLASHLNRDFLSASMQGMTMSHLIALVDNQSGLVVADTNPNVALIGMPEDRLALQYHVLGTSFFDYGASDLDAHFVSMIPREHYQKMGKEILEADRWNRALTGGVILACLCLILFTVTRRISKVTSRIDTFAEKELQPTILLNRTGDQLFILEERFLTLGQQIIETRNNLREQVAERTKEYQVANWQLEKEAAERVKTEEILRNTAMFQQAILDSAKHIIISIDIIGAVITLNGATESLLGYSEDEAIGKNLLELIYDQEEIKQYAEELSQEAGCRVEPDIEMLTFNACRKNQSYEQEWSYLSKTGERFPVRQAVTVIRDGNNDITGFLIIASDIREIKAAEQALRETAALNDKIIHEAPVGLAIYDKSGQCIIANDSAAKMIGASLPQILEQNYNDLESWRKSGLLNIAQKSLTERKRYYYEFDIITSFDRYGFFNSVFVPFTLHDELHLMLMIDDITERKQAEKRQRANLAEKEALLKEIHHRVKNNMQIAASLMFLQAQSVENPEALRVLQDSQERIKSMGLVHELLYKSGNLSKVPFNEYIETLVQSLQGSYGENNQQGISFHVEADGIALPVDTAVPCGLITNELITNSFKYAFTDNRPGKIIVRFIQEDDLYILTVSDNGIGLPADYDWKSAKSLGLNLVRTLAGQLDAEVRFENDNGLKTSLIFKAPDTQTENDHERQG
ncbi:MAG: PAS domain S-box protein [Candidatus Electrothrix communis]|nr:MAG: PAS domain S-box protein [Candidatus Electrothrix communis]